MGIYFHYYSRLHTVHRNSSDVVVYECIMNENRRRPQRCLHTFPTSTFAVLWVPWQTPCRRQRLQRPRERLRQQPQQLTPHQRRRQHIRRGLMFSLSTDDLDL